MAIYQVKKKSLGQYDFRIYFRVYSLSFFFVFWQPTLATPAGQTITQVFGTSNTRRSFHSSHTQAATCSSAAITAPHCLQNEIVFTLWPQKADLFELID